MSKEMNGSIALNDILPTLEATGKYSQDQLNAFGQLFAEHKYNAEEANKKVFKPQKIFYSNETFTIGDINFKIRKWSGRDTSRILPKLEFFYLSIPDSDKTKDDPSDFDPMEFAQRVIKQAFKEQQQGKTTDLVLAVYDEILQWIDPLGVMTYEDSLSTNALSADYLLDCPLGEVALFVKKFVEVNQTDFLLLFNQQHENLGSVISFLTGKIFSLIGNVITRVRALKANDSDGGTPLTGGTQSGTP